MVAPVEFDGFQWDDGNWPKCGKHGVSQAEIEALFRSGPAVYADAGHLLTEQRSLAVGDVGGRWLFAAFAVRRSGADVLIRPISARYMHQQEVERYEQQRQAREAAAPRDG